MNTTYKKYINAIPNTTSTSNVRNWRKYITSSMTLLWGWEGKFNKLSVSINNIVFLLKCYNTYKYKICIKTKYGFWLQLNVIKTEKVTILFLTLQRHNHATGSHVTFWNVPFVVMSAAETFSDLGIWNKGYSIWIKQKDQTISLCKEKNSLSF